VRKASACHSFPNFFTDKTIRLNAAEGLNSSSLTAPALGIAFCGEIG